jgi:hypothetical protein
MKTKKPPLFRIALSITVLVSSLLLQAFQPDTASAAQITNRSLTLQQGVDGPDANTLLDGGSQISGVVEHFFEFTIPTGGNVGSIRFQYCMEASGATCTAPAGLDATSVTLTAQNGATGFSIGGTPTANDYYITRTAAAVTATTPVSYEFSTITNPSFEGTFFARILTYVSEDTTGSATDTGTVTASTAEQIVIDGTMPESLVFCTGASVSTTAGVPDCTTATPGTISFDQLFSPQDTATTKSQMAASTNAGSGYSITVNGNTLGSGANQISAMTNDVLALGTSQFGLNLVANITTMDNQPVPVALGSAVAPAANGSNYRGQAVGGVNDPNAVYNTADTFSFVSGEPVADSASGGAGGTDAQIFTVSYVVNVPGSQPAGTYTTTLTYICTPTF